MCIFGQPDFDVATAFCCGFLSMKMYRKVFFPNYTEEAAEERGKSSAQKLGSLQNAASYIEPRIAKIVVIQGDAVAAASASQLRLCWCKCILVVVGGDLIIPPHFLHLLEEALVTLFTR